MEERLSGAVCENLKFRSVELDVRRFPRGEFSPNELVDETVAIGQRLVATSTQKGHCMHYAVNNWGIFRRPPLSVNKKRSQLCLLCGVDGVISGPDSGLRVRYVQTKLQRRP
jgi:hypothetical protein